MMVVAHCIKTMAFKLGGNMNERIRELARQADLYARSDNSSMLFDNYQKRYTEKFAELIVQECASIDFYKLAHIGTEDDYNVTQVIKQHFGVEE